MRKYLALLTTSSLLLSACTAPKIFRNSYTGFFGVVHLIILIWAIVDIVGSKHKATGTKVLWILVVAFFPLIGLILYIVAGREK